MKMLSIIRCNILEAITNVNIFLKCCSVQSINLKTLTTLKQTIYEYVVLIGEIESKTYKSNVDLQNMELFFEKIVSLEKQFEDVLMRVYGNNNG